VATQVAVPEFDGRIITVPFSFKEIDAEGLISYVPEPERCARVAGLAVNYATLRRVAPADKRVALVFSSYPTKYSRIGNAVGLDTPASALAFLNALRDNGYRIGEIPGVDSGDGDALIHAIIDALLGAAGEGDIDGQPVASKGTFTMTDGSTGHFVEVALETTAAPVPPAAPPAAPAPGRG
jgi:cobalamin biosynthesis Mg chelatase CobN